MRTRPITVEFMYKLDAEYLINNWKYLSEGVFVDKEYCKETEECRRILRPYLRAARKLPRYHKKCRLDEDTLVLCGVSYTKDNLGRLPEDLSGFKSSSKTKDNKFGFYGNMNRFSNFYPCKFFRDGRAYNCTEQFIQFQKAKFFNADSVAENILLASSGLECKQLARDIPNYNHENWKLAAKEKCEGGITAKFMQNLTIQNLLKETGYAIIVECCHDTLWGTGIPIEDEKCLDESLWYNQGIMGKILEDIRGKLLRNLRDTLQASFARIDDVPPLQLPETNTNEDATMEVTST